MNRTIQFMNTVLTASAARTGLPKLLAEAAKGHRFTITKRGRPVAAIGPSSDAKFLDDAERAVKKGHEAGRVAAATLPSAKAVILFGSCARGDARTKSDVDLVVVADLKESDGSYWAAWDKLALALGEYHVDLLLVTPAEWEAAESRVLQNAKREGVVLYGKL
jgi:prevent-host-death family protein